MMKNSQFIGEGVERLPEPSASCNPELTLKDPEPQIVTLIPTTGGAHLFDLLRTRLLEMRIEKKA